MLIEEAQIVRKMLKDEIHKRILSVCSSDEEFWKVRQPHIWNEVMFPLMERNNIIDNLDMKENKGVTIVTDCTNMVSIEDHTYDIVLFCSGVEHVIDVKRTLSEIKRVLKSNGYMLCTAPGVFPQHNDPIDTMLRLPTIADWGNLLGKMWRIIEFHKTNPIPAHPSYNFKELIFATIAKALPVS